MSKKEPMYYRLEGSEDGVLRPMILKRKPNLPPKGYRPLDLDEVIQRGDKMFGDRCQTGNAKIEKVSDKFGTIGRTPRILSQWEDFRYFRKISKPKVPTKIEIKFTDVLGNVATHEAKICNWARLAHDLKINNKIMEHEFLEEMVKFIKYEAQQLFHRISMDTGVVISRDKKENKNECN